MNVKQNVFINLPAEDIFAYVSDFENLVDWSSVMIAARKISPGAIEVGATIRGTVRFLGKWVDITFDIVEYEPGHCLTIKSISGIAPFLICYLFEQAVAGDTILRQKSLINHIEDINDV